ncbi:MAG TPA: FAD-binding oxidoreductase [Thermomicrobiales bacterium]|nr:FAD-binding oxidoreductase [Thermomicrobiales bacterium]
MNGRHDAAQEIAADVAVIGGGITGLSVAWQLSRLGVDRIVVLEAGAPGFKSTGQSSGGVRSQFTTRLEIEMSLASLPFFDMLLADSTFTGAFNRVGYAVLAGPEQAASLITAVDLQQSMGVRSEWIEQANLAARFPYINPDGLAGGTFCPDDGFISPWAIVSWLVDACRAAGVTILEHSPVDTVMVERGRVHGVASGTLHVVADVVVNAAGAWAGEVGKLAGVRVPVTPSPRVKYVTGPHPALPADMPLIIDLPTGAYVRSDDGGAMVGVKPPAPVMSFSTDVDPAQLRWMEDQASIRFPSLRGEAVARLVTGLYEVTPDGLPVAGAAPGVSGFFVVAGFNGHGIMHGPGVARAVAEQIASGASKTLDLSALAIDRAIDPRVTAETDARTLL